MSGSLKAKIIVVVVLLALTAALVGTCIAYRNRACEHTSLEHIEAVEPTCTESGNIEHWACKRCGATFKDESGAEEIGRVVRTALGHDLTRHSAVEPTCTEAGNVEYWECERCGVIFSDSAATKPLDDHIVAASGHDWNEPVWNWSDDYSKATAYFVCNKDSEHVESVTAKVTISSASATCTGSGRITYLAKAELDGKTYSDSEVVQSGALGHDWTVSEWIWSNDNTSVTAYFVCSRDPSHTHELTETEIVINEDPATCLADGKTEYSVEIAFDGNMYSDTAVVTLPATGHNWSNPEWTWSGNYSAAEATFTCLNDPLHTETVNAVVSILSSSATCTEPGNTEYKAELSFNENVYTDSQSVSGEALGHNWTVSEWIWSDDHTSVTAYFVCSRDPSHTHEVTETEIAINEVSATCEKEGKTEYSVEIAFDGNTYSDTAVVTHPATGHNWSAPEWTWSEDSSEAAATFTCLNDPSHTETLAAEVTIVDTTATCTAPGETGFMAKVTFNGKDYTDKQTVTGEALGHDWTVSEWIWSEDYTSVTANFVCARDPSHTDSVTATNIDINEVSATCEKEGKTEYSVEIVFDGNTYSDTAVVTHPATGHNWSAPEWTWSQDSSEAEATFTCQNDPSHTETLAAEVTIVDTTATCTMPGETGFMAKVTFNGKDHTDKQTVIYEALGHDWTVSEWIWSEDYTSVTAKFVCSRDNSHTREISGQINEDVIKPVSCTEDGESTFTATVSLDGDNYTDQKASVVIKAEGHVFSKNWSFDDVYHWHECTVCGEKRDLSKHELVDFICSVCNHTIIYTKGLEYTLSDDGASYLVSGIGTATDKDIKIMPRYNGKPVTGIADNAFANESINSVLIPDGVESIGAYAFYGCGYLETVVIPGSVKSIDSYAFNHCRRRTRIDYSGDITGWLNIEGLYNLLEDVSSSCELYFSGTKVEELVIPDGVTSIPRYAFSNLTGITSVTIPDSVTSIVWNAFSGCSGLKSVIIGNGVTSIGSSAFYDCSGLTEVTIPDSVTSIGSSAFSGCSGLQSLTIGTGVTSIGSYAFYNCTALSTLNWNAVNVSGFNSPNNVFSGAGTGGNGISVTFGDSVESIPSDLFYSDSNNDYKTPKITKITIGNNVKSIGSYAFRSVSSVSSVIIPVSVESIGEYAFYDIDTIYCEAQTKPTYWNDSWADISINVKWGYNNKDSGEFNYVVKDDMAYLTKYKGSGTEVTIPDTLSGSKVVSFGEIFKNNKNISKVVIGNNVTSVFPYAFYRCSGLQSVTIGNGVTSIGDWAFYNCRGLKSVTIGNGVTSIGQYAFDGCSGITRIDYSGNITGWLNISGLNYLLSDVSSSCELYIRGTKVEKLVIPDGVTSIPSYAFRYQTGITSVTIPDSLTSIGGYAFENCSGITRIDYSGDISGWLNISGLYYLMKYVSGNCELYIGGTKVEKLVIPDGVTSIPGSAFRYQTGITSVTIPDSLTSIGSYAFENCSGITRVDYSGNISGWLNIEGLDDLMYHVSSSCELYIGGTKVEKLVIPDGVTSIPGSAFRYQTGITSVKIPDSLTSIGSYAFENCSGITRIDYSGDISGWLNIRGLDDLMEYVSSSSELYFGGTKVEELVIPGGVTSIPSYAFSNLSGITSVTIPDSVTFIGWHAFENCSSLTEVTIPDSVTSIGQYAFSGCSGLKSVTIGNGVTSIGESAFKDCSSLTSLTIPDSVTSIVWNAFSGCSGLKTVTIGNGVTSIEDYAFENFSSLQSVTIGNGVTSIGAYAFSGCSSLQSVTIGNGVTSIERYAFSGCSSLTSVTIPDSVTSIEWNAFSGCSGLTSVTIPDSVTSIGTYAFSGCSSLTSVTIPGSVTSIEMRVFYGCSGLKSVTIGNGVTSIGREAFLSCSSLTEVTIPDSVTSIGYLAFQHCSSLTSITIPDSVTSIGDGAFSGCSGLQSVTIGNGVTSIGRAAFNNCSSLTSATFKNTSGWSAGSTSLSSGNLADEYTAAQYLRSTYASATWTRR